jgi:poly(A) polymerase
MSANDDNTSFLKDTGEPADDRHSRRRARREERKRQRAQEGEPSPRRAREAPRRRARVLDSDGGAASPQAIQTPVEFPEGAIDAAAEKVVRRLTKAGHEAYLVGGCVRDLLVGKSPKDFDVATSARPEEVKSLLRNSRIIGRRFRLVHVLFPHGHVIETATFRRNPPQGTSSDSEDLLIRSDNFFGRAHEDARRRDFTINGLFYDFDRRAVLDWVDGMHDIKQRTVRTIGDPYVRFQEDPVRMLRAIKFAARLDFGIDPEVYHAAVQCRGTLAMAARPRLSEEILRLMRGGAAHRSVWLMWEMGMLDILIPELSTYLADSENDARVWELLRKVDQRTSEIASPLDDVLLWSALLLEPMQEACQGAPDRLRASREFLEPLVDRLSVPRRIADAVQRIVAMLPRVAVGKASRFKRSPVYPVAIELLELSEGEGLEAPQSSELEQEAGPKRRRRRPRKER